jgi:hypothetical protein
MSITRSSTGMRLAKKRHSSADQEERKRVLPTKKTDDAANSPKIRLSARFHSVTNNVFTGQKRGAKSHTCKAVNAAVRQRETRWHITGVFYVQQLETKRRERCFVPPQSPPPPASQSFPKATAVVVRYFKTFLDMKSLSDCWH